MFAKFINVCAHNKYWISLFFKVSNRVHVLLTGQNVTDRKVSSTELQKGYNFFIIHDSHVHVFSNKD